MDCSIDFESLLDDRVEYDDTNLVVGSLSIIVVYGLLEYLLDLSLIGNLIVRSFVVRCPIIELWQVLIKLEDPLLNEENSGSNARRQLEVILSLMQLRVSIDHYPTNFIDPQIGYVIHSLVVGSRTLTESLKQGVHHSDVDFLEETYGTWIDTFHIF